MNILQAKQEIKDTVKAYLLTDENGTYRIPVTAQRPILLIGPPESERPRSMEQIAVECGFGCRLYDDPPYPPECHRTADD